MTENDSTDVLHDQDSGLVYRIRPPAESGEPAVILLHGLTGDEDVMWLLQSALPKAGLMGAPRGLYDAADGGYSWLPEDEGPDISINDLASSVERVTIWLDGLLKEHGLGYDRCVLVGFSQGAALAFALAHELETRPGAVVCLAGFLPDGLTRKIEGLSVYWGHGTQDETLPIDRARSDMEELRKLGVELQVCEAEVGHKVGVECMRGLRSWLEERLAAAG